MTIDWSRILCEHVKASYARGIEQKQESTDDAQSGENGHQIEHYSTGKVGSITAYYTIQLKHEGY